jgi:hypothetical protein
MNARSIGRYTLGMPATTTKLTVSLPKDLLARADQLLVRPGEGRSSLITRVLTAAVRAAEEAAIDADYERAYPDDFTCGEEQQRTFAALERAQAEAMRAQLGIEGHG